MVTVVSLTAVEVLLQIQGRTAPAIAKPGLTWGSDRVFSLGLGEGLCQGLGQVVLLGLGQGLDQGLIQGLWLGLGQRRKQRQVAPTLWDRVFFRQVFFN